MHVGNVRCWWQPLCCIHYISDVQALKPAHLHSGTSCRLEVHSGQAAAARLDLHAIGACGSWNKRRRHSDSATA